MRALGLNLLAATCVVGLMFVTPTPAKPRVGSLSLGFDQTNVSVVEEVGYRNRRYRSARPIGVIATHIVHLTIAPTDALASSLVATSVLGLVPTNALDTTATGDAGIRQSVGPEMTLPTPPSVTTYAFGSVRP